MADTSAPDAQGASTANSGSTGPTVTLSRGLLISILGANVVLLIGLAVVITALLVGETAPNSATRADPVAESTSGSDAPGHAGSGTAATLGSPNSDDAQSPADPDHVANRFKIIWTEMDDDPASRRVSLQRLATGRSKRYSIAATPDTDLTIVDITETSVVFRRRGIEAPEVLTLAGTGPSDPSVPRLDLREFVNRNGHAPRDSSAGSAALERESSATPSPSDPSSPISTRDADPSTELADSDEPGQTIVLANGERAALPPGVDADSVRRLIELQGSPEYTDADELLPNDHRTHQYTLDAMDVVAFRDSTDAMIGAILMESAVSKDGRAAGIRIVTPIDANEPLYRYGFVPNDVVISINGHSVLRLTDLDTAIEDRASFRDGVTLVFWRGGALWETTLTVDYAAVAALDARLARGDTDDETGDASDD